MCRPDVPQWVGSMNYETVVIAKRWHIKRLREKLRGTKTSAPEYGTLINEIGALSMEYHQFIEAGTRSVHADLLYPRKIT
jgi:hypothetical protein